MYSPQNLPSLPAGPLQETSASCSLDDESFSFWLQCLPGEWHWDGNLTFSHFSCHICKSVIETPTLGMCKKKISSLGKFSGHSPLLSFYITQHCWEESGCKCWSGEEGTSHSTWFLMTLQSRETTGSKLSSPLWTPLGEPQCTPDVSEHGGPWSVWFPSLWTFVRTLPTLRDILLLSARI